ncbi:hypothetical protein STANM309S_02111 [Streptomyces tanashiensis]
MAAATSVVIYASVVESLTVFLVGFIGLFVLSGLGDGYLAQDDPGDLPRPGAPQGPRGRRARPPKPGTTALRGLPLIIGAVGALGELGINLAFRQSFQTAGTGTAAFVAFLAFYAACMVVGLGGIPSGPGHRPRDRRGGRGTGLRQRLPPGCAIPRCPARTVTTRKYARTETVTRPRQAQDPWTSKNTAPSPASPSASPRHAAPTS